MTFRAIWDLVRFHWVFLLVATVLGAAGGFGLASVSQTQYTARSEVFVGVSNGQDASEIAQGATYAIGQARNFAAVSTRQIVLQEVIDDLDLDYSVNELRQKISTSVPLNTSIISIKATDPSSQRSAQIANAVASSLADSVNRLSPRADKGAKPVEVQSVEQAQPPKFPSSPKVAVLMILGAVLGFALALLTMGIKDYFRAKVRGAGQAIEITKSPVIGSVMRSRETWRHPMALTSRTTSVRAEQYRQIRTNLRFLQLDHGHKVFVITSAMAGEGKSTTAANVAAAIAAAGSSVCLVEADLRRPTLSRVLDLEGGLGLTNVLANEAEVDDVLQPWGPDGLQVLLAGETPPNPSELLESMRLHEVLSSVRDRFEVTIIDCPPVLPVTDATILGRQFGGALMVVSERKVEIRDLRAAVERMRLVDAPILGTIMTMSREGNPGDQYYDTNHHGRRHRINVDASVSETSAERVPEEAVTGAGDGASERR